MFKLKQKIIDFLPKVRDTDLQDVIDTCVKYKVDMYYQFLIMKLGLQ